MKKTIQVLALVLAIGAAIQSLRAYASDSSAFSIEEEEYKMFKLINLRKEFTANGETASLNSTVLSEEFPEITNHEQLNEAISRQALRYIQAIGAGDALINVIKKPEFQPLRNSEPGI